MIETHEKNAAEPERMQREEKGAGELIVGLDIGTTKICCIVAEAFGDGALDVIGVGTTPSLGLKRASSSILRVPSVPSKRLSGLRKKCRDAACNPLLWGLPATISRGSTAPEFWP